jgi:(p)ppGpp synthase/HD superfamily hydrolase
LKSARNAGRSENYNPPYLQQKMINGFIQNHYEAQQEHQSLSLVRQVLVVQDKDNKMSDDLLQKAIDYATEKHKGQKYGDKPYITHPLAVLERVKNFTGFTPMWCAAVLHDVVEDCGVTNSDIRHEFGSTVAEIVLFLTRVERQSYANYIETVTCNSDAVKVKIADLEENLSNNPPKHLKDKYELALLYLRK